MVYHYRGSIAGAAAGIGALAVTAGIPVALGYGVLASPPGGVALLDRIDHLSSTVLLPLSAIALSVGWAWRT